ncbi:uracil-DNA glycosylase [bacterium]|nr:uracil-DNA glycosylase [bacterium]
MNNRLLEVLKQSLEAQGITGLPRDWFAHQQVQEQFVTGETSAMNQNNMEQVGKSTGASAQLVSSDLRYGQTLSELNTEAQQCTRCRLCETRNKVVFGVGNTKSPKICFVGEGPGADEDQQGEPFVGRAGRLLTAAITKGIGIAREEVYICNVVKCRPPENRAPLPDEVEACRPFLERQIALIKPEVIITLGSPAFVTLTGNKTGITKVRGTWLEWQGIPLMPTFHPAYLLRNPPAKKPFWEDLKTVMLRLGIPINAQSI